MRQINKAAVLGAGVMGATIAAHLANAGMDVLLLDIVPRKLSDDEKAKGLTLEDGVVRNKFAQNGLNGLLKMKPAPFFLKSYAKNIEIGNFDDDMSKLRDCDLVIEVVIENMDIKKSLFTEKVVPNLAKGAILATNTSGLSVNELAEVLPEEVRKNFLVTHFFNPPRYMRLLELVPCKYTDPDVLSSLAALLSKRLGKGIVYGKDTPNFIGNRIGVYVIFSAFKHLQDMEMTVEEADAAVGTAIGFPKTAIFKLADLVGNDTIEHIGNNSYELLTDDEAREVYKIPAFLNEMVKAGRCGNKTRQGFYKVEKSPEGKKISYLDLNTGEYKSVEKPKFASILAVKMVDDVSKRVQMVLAGTDKAAEFAWKLISDMLVYTVNRIPEISDDIVNVDNAMKWGYNWELGPFEILDAIGVQKFVGRLEKEGRSIPAALKNIEQFYKFENGKKYYYDLVSKEYVVCPVDENQINLTILKKTASNVVEKTSNSSVIDIGDGVFCLEFHSKMNAITGDILSMTHKAIKRAENEGVGLVIGNRGANFSVGANLMMIAVAIAEGAYEDIDMAVRMFQKATMAVKYSKIPVVAAPFGMTLGGGCEFTIHADARVASAETYMGLVEIGVGLLPGGGGTKEMCLRAIQDAALIGTDVQPFIFKNFQNIGLAKVSMSADEAYGLGYMRSGDSVTMNIDNQIADAKKKVISLASNYRPSKPVEGVKAPGRSIAASLKSSLWNMKMGGYITEYEEVLGSAIANAICGGDVAAGTLISEQYLLDIEREGFLKLCTQKKTMERIQHMLKKGKPLRN